MRVLVLNAGSSSLKLSLVGPDDRVLTDNEFAVGEGRLDPVRLGSAIQGMEGVEAIGHRVVHGGPRYRQSVRLDGEVVRYLASISDLAHRNAMITAEALGSAAVGIATDKALRDRIAK